MTLSLFVTECLRVNETDRWLLFLQGSFSIDLPGGGTMIRCIFCLFLWGGWHSVV
jgi:hypothetical protein